MVVARRYLISGLVQGVGFRFFTLEAGAREGLGGFVRNLEDGRVEAQAEGEQAGLDRFERALYQGPAWSRVEQVHVENLVPTGQSRTFRIDST